MRARHFVIFDFLVIGHHVLPDLELPTDESNEAEDQAMDPLEKADEEKKHEAMLEELVEEIRKDSDPMIVDEQEVSRSSRPSSAHQKQPSSPQSCHQESHSVDKNDIPRIGSERRRYQSPHSISTNMADRIHTNASLVDARQHANDRGPTAITSEHEPRKAHTNESRAIDVQSTQAIKILPRDPEWISRATIEHHRRCHLNVHIAESERCPTRDGDAFRMFCERFPLPLDGQACVSKCKYSLFPIMDGVPLRPFSNLPRIVPLAAVTGKQKSRNQDVDILAVIAHVDDACTKPATMSLKRDIRVQDPSVDKAVTVSVFMDPVNFYPSVGTVALFRHVTTHDWRTGALNAYPARVKGREWFIPNPHCLGLRQEAQDLEKWWHSSRVPHSTEVT